MLLVWCVCILGLGVGRKLYKFSLSLSLSIARDSLLIQTAYHPQWGHCNFSSILEEPLDEGRLNNTVCTMKKTSLNSAVRVTFNGNIHLTDCSDCCARWFITINDSECVDPAPIEAIIYTVNGTTVNLHRSSTITGMCECVYVCTCSKSITLSLSLSH